MIDYWIQRADFEAKDAAAADTSELCRLFESHDWTSELQYRQSLDAGGKESCDPGFGVVLPDGFILHICPDDATSLLCHYHYTTVRRILGLFPSQRQDIASWSEPVKNACTLIELFVGRQHEELLHRSRRVV